jgi:uncharacterized protein (TIGR03437 family)
MRTTYNYLFLTLILAAAGTAQIVLDPGPARVLGHPSMTPAEQLVVTNLSPNFSANGGMFLPQGVAVDTSGSTPILYVADYGNNRVLAWKNATSATLTNLQNPDLIIGQPNADTTFPLTNGGLANPTAVLVDPSGNLYIADAGNNRVLRYPSPFSTAYRSTPDIVLGQPDPFSSRSQNQGGNPTAKTLNLSVLPFGDSIYRTALAMDSAHNLFVTDRGNGRVLRYPASVLTSGAVDPAADMVIGEAGFTTVGSPSSSTDPNILYYPAGLAFDAQGHLFVSDGAPRLVVYPATVTTGVAGAIIPAIRFAGVVSPAPATATASTLSYPLGIVTIANGPAVIDATYNRLLIFDPFSSSDWTVKTGDTTLSTPPPVAVAVLGQGTSLTNFTSVLTNAGNPQAVVAGTETATFSGPTAAFLAGTDLFVADSANNRVLVYANAGSPTSIPTTPSVVLGQSAFPYDSPNSIQGKEFYFVASSSDAGIVVDSSSTPPHLYVSDPNNHRVLGFADARVVGPGVKADIVIGEPDLQTAVCNFGGVTNSATEALPRQPTQSSLCYPTGVAVDSSGNLYVADSDNGRVLRFPAPFNASNSSQQANLVLGQSGFTGISNPQASQSVMEVPYGLVVTASGLLVSDLSANRVLLFPLQSASNGEAATKVIGQTNFTATAVSALSSPHHIAVDTINELYVADTGHNQVQVFVIPSGTSTSQPTLSFTTRADGGGLSAPQAVWVNTSAVAGYHNDIWVGDRVGLSRYAQPSPFGSNIATLSIAAVEVQAGATLNCPGTSGFCEFPALAITQDSFGNLYAADGSNRVAIHYPALRATNSANYACAMGCALGGNTYPESYLAPGALATLFFIPQSGGTFTSTAVGNTVLPVPTKLGGVEVLVNGLPSPIIYAGPGQINFILPFEAPESGQTALEVVNATTSQVLGSGTTGQSTYNGTTLGLNMNAESPAFFTSNSAGTGQIAALNCNKTPCENTVNNTTNPANTGSILQLYLTGQGLVSGAPGDGVPPSGAITTGATPVVYIGGSSASVKYSGLAPGFPGLWQINVEIPSSTELIQPAGFPTGVFPVLVEYNGAASNSGANNGNPAVATTIVINTGI